MYWVAVAVLIIVAVVFKFRKVWFPSFYRESLSDTAAKLARQRKIK